MWFNFFHRKRLRRYSTQMCQWNFKVKYFILIDLPIFHYKSKSFEVAHCVISNKNCYLNQIYTSSWNRNDDRIKMHLKCFKYTVCIDTKIRRGFVVSICNMYAKVLELIIRIIRANVEGFGKGNEIKTIAEMMLFVFSWHLTYSFYFKQISMQKYGIKSHKMMFLCHYFR